ncbi:MAG: DHH family phosphoesterase [Candidatus Woesearchaeota archaeon]
MKTTINDEAKDVLFKINTLIENSKNPYFLFDDDPDGLCSFLLIYKKYKKGNFSVVRGKPRVDQNFIQIAKNHNADLIVILDKPEMNFTEESNRIVWIDHHPPVANNTLYFNPLNFNLEPYPTTFWVYQLIQDYDFLAALGIVTDWFLLDIVEKVAKDEKYKDLFPEKLTIEEILFNSEFGKIGKILTFLLKGESHKVKADIKRLANIENYEKILTSFPRVKPIAKEYEKLLEKALKQEYSNVLVFLYKSKHSLTGVLSNELLYHFPDKDLIVVGRKKLYEYSLSLRSKKYNVNRILEQSLKGIRGSGGGHEKACGAIIHEHDLELFLDNLRYFLEKEKQK